MAATEYDFILTRNEIIEEAFFKIGDLGYGQVLGPDQLNSGIRKINLITKRWGEDGYLLFSTIEDSVTLVSGTASYLIPTANGLSFVERANYVDTGSTYLEIERITIEEYIEIPNKTDTGVPSVFSVLPSSGLIQFWPTPNTTNVVKLFGYRKLKDWQTSEGTGEFPSRWQSALIYALAVELGEDSKIPLDEIKYLRSISEQEYRKALGRETDTTMSVRMTPSYTNRRRRR